MIVFHIQKYVIDRPDKFKKHQKTRDQFTGPMGSEDHKKFILQRAITNCKFNVGEYVKYRKHIVLITGIYGNDFFDWIDWKGLSPQFVEGQYPDGSVGYFNPGNLSRTRRR